MYNVYFLLLYCMYINVIIYEIIFIELLIVGVFGKSVRGLRWEGGEL